jgi:hypothetical protein
MNGIMEDDQDLPPRVLSARKRIVKELKKLAISDAMPLLLEFLLQGELHAQRCEAELQGDDAKPGKYAQWSSAALRLSEFFRELAEEAQRQAASIH